MNVMKVEVSTAWWLIPYFYILAIVCTVCRTEPDEQKLTRMINRALRFKLVQA